MEESAHLIASRKGHRSHVIRLFKKIDKLTRVDQLDEKQVCSMTMSLDQLKNKCKLITQMDEKVL